MTTPPPHPPQYQPGFGEPRPPKKKNKVLRVALIVVGALVGVFVLLTLVGACMNATMSDEDKAAQHARMEQRKADNEAEKAEKQAQKDAEKAQKDADKQAEKDKKEAEKSAANLDDDQVTEEFLSWYFSRYGVSSWEELADQDQTGSTVWARHIVDAAVVDGSLTIVTNLDPSNPEGQKLAEGMAAQIKNGTEIAHQNGELPLSLEKNLEFLQVMSLDGKVIAKADKGFNFD